MIDKMILNVKLSVEDVQKVADKSKLQRYLKGDEPFYISKDDYKFCGIFIKIKDGKLQMKCSLHKYYNKITRGVLENCDGFSMALAQMVFYRVMEDIGINPESANVTYYEIGFNINTDRPPLEYLKQIKNVGFGRNRRELFVDAKYEINRQKTSLKTKTVKKYFKIYDKGFEMADRKRTDKSDTPKILRIETVYKKIQKRADQFFNLQNLNEMARQFFEDWLMIEFEKTITAEKGVKYSQKIKAEKILTIGREAYLIEANKLHNDLLISDKEYRTIKEFVRDWDKNKSKFAYLPSTLESEIKAKLGKAFENEIGCKSII